jgi:hypothetical protein
VEAFVNGGGAIGLLDAGGAMTVVVARLSKVLVSKCFFRDSLAGGWVSQMIVETYGGLGQK